MLGGARSGKSAWAESLFDAAGDAATPVDYVATARPWPGSDGFDPDFAARIDEHRRRRPAHWRTVDDVDPVAAVRAPSSPLVLFDDVGTWLTGVFDRERLWEAPRGSVAPWADELVAAVAAWDGVAKQHDRGGDGDGDGGVEPHLVLVTPEVGMGVIPEHRSGRLFRDEIGRLNARLAEACDRVVLVVAGLPTTLK